MKTIVVALFLCSIAIAQKPADKNSDLGIQFTFRPSNRFVEIYTSGPELLLIEDRDQKLIVKISLDGKVQYGESYKPEDGAKAFWEALAGSYQAVCEQRQKESKPEDSNGRTKQQPK